MPIPIPEIPGLSRDQVLTLMNCRGLRQYVEMVGHYLAGRCPFCDPLNAKNKVIYQNASWRAWLNPFPLKDTELHVIMATVRHIASVEYLTPAGFRDMGEVFFALQRELKFPGGCLAMRFGSPEYNAGSVLHQHANIIVPNGNGSVQVTLAKDADKVAGTIERMWAFELLRNGASVESLTDEQRKLVEGRLE